jgi:uncharacterized protein (DUF58 family)
MIPAEILRKVRRIQIRTAALATDLFAGQYHSAFKGRGIEFDEVREYQPGDDIRTLDWNVTARFGHPFVKSYREERELTVMLVADISRSQDFGTRAQFRRELAAELGAVLAFAAIRNNDKVGALLFSDRVECFVPARKGPRHVLRVVRELLYRQPAGPGTDVCGALEHLDRVVSRRAVVFLISDFLCDLTAPALGQALGIARRRHDVIPVWVRDPRERELPALGFVEAWDPETGQQVTVDLGSRAVRRRFAALAEERATLLRWLFRRRRMDLIEVETGQSFVEPLVRFFRRRETRR